MENSVRYLVSLVRSTYSIVIQCVDYVILFIGLRRDLGCNALSYLATAKMEAKGRRETKRVRSRGCWLKRQR